VTAPLDDPGLVRLTAWADGRVQGVGFRAWVRMKATRLGLTGSATNLDDGRVEVVAEGPEQQVRALLAELTGGDTPGRVTRVTERWGRPQGRGQGFTERLPAVVMGPRIQSTIHEAHRRVWPSLSVGAAGVLNRHVR
jgi:acylphosphatase